MHLIEVAFPGNRKEFFEWPESEPPPLKAPVIVDAFRNGTMVLAMSGNEIKRIKQAAREREAQNER